MKANHREAPPYLNQPPRLNEQELYLRLREGTSVRVRLANRLERVVSFVIDAMLLLAIIVVGILVIAPLVSGDETRQFSVFGIWTSFCAIFYFQAFEVLWNGQTPGKRLLGLRTVRVDGEDLNAWTIWLRNSTQALEFSVPVSLVGLTYFTADTLFPIFAVMAGLIVTVMLVLPFLLSYEQRLGDFIAGTIVIEEPDRRTRFLPPFVQVSSSSSFEPEQLKHFGTYELQILESFIHQARAGDSVGLEQAADALCGRFGYTKVSGSDAVLFIEQFYVALSSDIQRSAVPPAGYPSARREHR